MKAGFQRVLNADGNADDLYEFVRDNTQNQQQRLIHIANQNAAGALVSRLVSAGFNAAFVPLYETQAATEFTVEVRAFLNRNATGDVALFHSAKAATAFRDLLTSLPQRVDLSNLTALSISPNAGLPLEALSFREIMAAKAPNETALIALFDQFLGCNH